MLRKVEPEEMQAIAQLAADNPDLRTLPSELAQLRALRAATAGAPALRPATFREALKGLEAAVLTPAEVRAYCGLPPRRQPLAALLVGVARTLQVVLLTLTRPLWALRPAA